MIIFHDHDKNGMIWNVGTPMDLIHKSNLDRAFVCVRGHEPTSQKLHDFRVGLLVGVIRTTKDRPQNIPQEGAVRGKSGATAWHNEATGDLMSHFSHLSSLIHMNPYVENAAG